MSSMRNKTKGAQGSVVVEIQKDGKYRVCLNEDELIRVVDIETREKAEEIARAMRQAYIKGTFTYTAKPPWRLGDDDDY